MRILCAEYDSKSCEMLKTELKDYTLTFTNSGSKAAALTVRNNYDAIVMNVDLLEMSGYDAAILIKTYKPEIPIIGMNNLSPEDSIKIKRVSLDPFDIILRGSKKIKSLLRKKLEHYLETQKKPL